eukprot:TRINITY_DN14122_c0_g1_i2.p1 TRINITY_DN14122_c0_g1~~TRINITY_DN14122_c0_g1_i2.p1  ORF type:complete len:154 (+),score=20.73 TRINITY_DN14122_c0_g1_i2:74-535(+)
MDDDKEAGSDGEENVAESEPCEVLNDYDDEEASELGLNTDPDPLYDPEMDENDAKWVAKRFKFTDHQSDAILNCPACFTVVCFDCQKHEQYDQYRAMFVQNCRVYTARQVKPLNLPDDQDVFHPVHCHTCNTEIGARDSEEVIHFFNVLATPL